LEGRKWIYLTTSVIPPNEASETTNDMEGVTRIVFLDITNSTNILRTLIITLICVGATVLLLLLWISYRFAVRAVRPIEENYNKQKQFIADASHELKTPISVVSANIDAITSSGAETVDSQSEWFGYIKVELARMSRLVNDLLYLAKSENVRKADVMPFNLSADCEKICASMEALFYEKKKILETEIEGNITIVADEEKIMQVLHVLLDNAGKYTPEGGSIKVKLTRNKNWAILQVINSGETIPESDLPKIFDRFYRADASRSTQTGGSGLGLSIAATIVEQFGGFICAQSSQGLTTFEVKLHSQKSM